MSQFFRSISFLCLVALCTVATAAQQSSIQRDPSYPAHWWRPVEDLKKPDWEILPQEAKPGEVILSKRNELGLLSNFAATPFTYHSKRYASLEGFWQAMLYPEGPTDPRAKFPGLEWKYTRDQVAQMTAFEAKRAGDLAEENNAEDGNRVGQFRRKTVRLPAETSRTTLPAYRHGHPVQGYPKSRGEEGAPHDRRFDPEAGSSSRAQRTSSLALL